MFTKSAPPFTRVAGGVDLDFASTAVLRIEQFSGLTKWESDQKAKARINVLLGEVGGDDGGKDKADALLMEALEDLNRYEHAEKVDEAKIQSARTRGHNLQATCGRKKD